MPPIHSDKRLWAIVILLMVTVVCFSIIGLDSIGSISLGELFGQSEGLHVSLVLVAIGFLSIYGIILFCIGIFGDRLLAQAALDQQAMLAAHAREHQKMLATHARKQKATLISYRYPRC